MLEDEVQEVAGEFGEPKCEHQSETNSKAQVKVQKMDEGQSLGAAYIRALMAAAAAVGTAVRGSGSAKRRL